MRGLEILARTMSRPRLLSKDHPCEWQYHPRSDHHSKVVCWGVMFDVMLASELLRSHIAKGKVAFGINHRLTDHTNNRRKSLDLVVCRPTVLYGEKAGSKKNETFSGLAKRYGLELTTADGELLSQLPELHSRPVGMTLIALEAKAVMTEFGKARPRLYDELESSHVVVHGDTDTAIAVGLALVNTASVFVSPTNNPCLKWGAPRNDTMHEQPRQAQLTVEKIRSLPRRNMTNTRGFDAISAVTIECTNDGKSPVEIVWNEEKGAVPAGDVLHYATMINRIAGIYQNRFPDG